MSDIPFEEWVKNADLEDPINILKHSPEWIFELDASTLVHLPVRLANRLGIHGIKKTKDLLDLSSHAILKWPKVGKKSLVQLSRSIIATVLAGYEKESTYKFQAVDICLRDQWNSALDSLTDRESSVLKKRLGYDTGNSMTLEEIGGEYSVTRERIRQIEVKAKKKLKPLPLWRDKIIEKKVIALMSHRVEPCYLDLISIEDNWFKGFSDRTKCLAAIIEDACNGDFKCISIGGRDVISRITCEDWIYAKQEIISILEGHLSSQLTNDDVILLIESYLGKYAAQELTLTLYDEITPQLHFFPINNGGFELASIGKGASSIVLAVLKASPIPLHYSEAHTKCLEMGCEIDVRRAHNALSEVALLFSLGTYGLRKHLKLSTIEENEILSQLEDIILSGIPERQWNSSALAEKLYEQFPETPEVVDKYVVNIILGSSKLMISLGRFVWVRSEQAKQKNISRIDLQEASTALIKKAGRPMSMKELKAQIVKQRGMSQYFCLKVTKSITRVSPSVWGLIDRDFYLQRSQITIILDHLHSMLLLRDRGVYIDDARQVINGIELHIPEKLTNYMIFSLAQTDSRFVVRKGQILGLSDWQNAKLMTIREASCQAASELKEFSYSEDLRPRIEALIGRKVSGNIQFHEGIRDAGFIYHEKKHKWLRK